MKIGFITPNYPGERRIALLPGDMEQTKGDIVLEEGFGHAMNIPDSTYKGCTFLSRADVFKTCDAIFSLKLLQETDYKYLRQGQMILGWTHPLGSGKAFFEGIAQEKSLKIVDLDNIHPMAYYHDKSKLIDFIPKNFIWKNSKNAGIASCLHALISLGSLPDSSTRVAILSSGNVAQGAFDLFSKFHCDIRMFYRNTMNEFVDTFPEYDIIVNCIELADRSQHILTKADLRRVKRGALIIDAAADPGYAIDGIHLTSIDRPLYYKDGKHVYAVNNAPSVLYRQASRDISKSLSTYIFNEDVQRFWDFFDQFTKKSMTSNLFSEMNTSAAS